MVEGQRNRHMYLPVRNTGYSAIQEKRKHILLLRNYMQMLTSVPSTQQSLGSIPNTISQRKEQ